MASYGYIRGPLAPILPYHAQISPVTGKMGFFDSVKGKFSRRDSSTSNEQGADSPTSSETPRSFAVLGGRQGGFSHAANDEDSAPARTTPTRRPHPSSSHNQSLGAPPAYSPPSANSNIIPTAINGGADDRYAFLSAFDTVFLIDDSGSMAGRSWRETAAALRTIAPICTSHDADGVDIYFLNHADSAEYRGIKAVADVERVFGRVQPGGGTPTGIRLNHLLRPYLAAYNAAPETTKPLNVIVITDGVPSDDVESVIIGAARKLDRLDAPAWQVGIQFFQVGNEPGATEALQDLDEGLADLGGGIRDMVDTMPWEGKDGTGQGLDGEGILKVVLGAVNRRLDRKKASNR